MYANMVGYYGPLKLKLGSSINNFTKACIPYKLLTKTTTLMTYLNE